MRYRTASRFALSLLASLALTWAQTTPAPAQETPTAQTAPASLLATDAQPPLAKKVPKTIVTHGDRREDDYFWLRQKSNPDVIAYLNAENDYADKVMAPTKPLQETLYKEMLRHIKQTDTAVPYRLGAYLYYTRTLEGQQYPVYCRKKGSQRAQEEILLDLNALAKGQKFLGLGAFDVSDDGNLLAYSLDTTGFRQYTLHVKDLRSGKVLPDTAQRVDSVVWAADNATLFYVVEDNAKRAYRLYRHRLGAKRDARITEEKDERFDLGIGRTRSKAYLLLTATSHTTSEARYLPAGSPTGVWKVIAPRAQGHEYYVEHRGGLFYIRTNSGGRNFRLVTAPVATPDRRHWREIVPHRHDVMLEDVDCFANYLVQRERRNGLPQFLVTDLRTGRAKAVAFPEPTYDATAANNPEFDTDTFRYSYMSLVTPASVFDFDMKTGRSLLRKRQEVPGGFHRDDYVSERLYATATDGVKVPISLVHRKGVARDGTAPLYMEGYGSYGIPEDVYFSSANLSLLDRGVVVAFAHIRGGGDLGKFWHDAGRMRNKRNTFTDFIACTEYLTAEKVADPQKVVVTGASAGGLLMGAVTNLRPDLFRAVITEVPFVDVLNTMLDASLPLTVGEYEEWGNPNRQGDYAYMKTYSPYDNIEAKAYPNLLVRTSLNDSQVMYWEPAKYVARLRSLKTDNNVLLFKTNMAAGHGGASGRYDNLRDLAFDYAFLLNEVGITQ